MTKTSFAKSRWLRRSGALSGCLLCSVAYAGEPEREEVSASTARKAPEQAAKDDVNAIGSISVGHAHDGALFNGVRMPDGPHWVVALPQYAYGTDETISAIVDAITHVNEKFPDSPKLIIGSISKEGGGPFKPHKSHQSGRDADIGFYYKPGFKVAEPGTIENLDLERTWQLLRAFIVESDVEMILIDRSVQSLLEDHALRSGEDHDWVIDVFHGDGTPYSSLIKHVPGHKAHMHVRFVSPIARRRGLLAYPTLVSQGHLVLKQKEVTHEVEKGDTLLGLARRYRVSTDQLRAQNQLESSLIRVGQKLTIHKPVHLRGAFEPVTVPKRRLPPAQPEPAHPAKTAQRQ